ncbi:Hypothetical protein GbCGDNIH2_0756 [Granulibacter bethesdensis]|uniref:Anti-sigma factor NepR domain-containing protein n=2 Tax=Granulibacter bethesdensis TaxID=364410 RepID=Q0BU48_GRABC|nr:Hypothetical protein GbCGDNIH1_0756 [Granulibacter bethesdensis CGDNIH1]AHJ69528.1 Hypothetical protein GbCGDNIH2_0756 [Granulibacter bethesdensis]APH51459.1 Hypothetical protein GbCGDNIH5_0756 [Granulibacter bethesdensis]APH64152.1 Hypothetical protein GbCGDNIH1I4_0756 [Granulibacter bethesdensis]
MICVVYRHNERPGINQKVDAHWLSPCQCSMLIPADRLVGNHCQPHKPRNIVSMKKRKDDRPASESGSAKTDGAFDLWLQRSLHQIFDDIAKEPIPEELLRLIEKDRAK